MGHDQSNQLQHLGSYPDIRKSRLRNRRALAGLRVIDSSSVLRALALASPEHTWTSQKFKQENRDLVQLFFPS
jgi:hypothetical protein